MPTATDPAGGHGAAPVRRHDALVVPVGMVVGVLAVSSSAILSRYALATAGAVAVAFWRCAGGALALAPLGAREARRAVPGGRRVAQMAASGVLLAVHFSFFIGAIALTTVGSAVLLATMSPVFVAVGGARFLDEPVSRRTAAGIVVSLVGAAVVTLADASGPALGGTALLGDAMALLSAVAVAGYLLLGRAVRRDVAPATYSGTVYATAALVLLGAAAVGGVPLQGFSRTSWLAIAAIVVGPQLLGHTVFNTLLSRVAPAVVSVVILSEPVLATLLAAVLLSEVPPALFWVGAPVVAAGVLLATTTPRASRATRPRHHRGTGSL